MFLGSSSGPGLNWGGGSWEWGLGVRPNGLGWVGMGCVLYLFPVTFLGCAEAPLFSCLPSRSPCPESACSPCCPVLARAVVAAVAEVQGPAGGRFSRLLPAREVGSPIATAGPGPLVSNHNCRCCSMRRRGVVLCLLAGCVNGGSGAVGCCRFFAVT